MAKKNKFLSWLGFGGKKDNEEKQTAEELAAQEAAKQLAQEQAAEQERVEGREALTDAVVGGVTLNPTFAGVSTAGKGIVATAKAIGSGGLRNLIAKNSNKILGFFAKKLGLKGSTTGVNSTRSLNM